jgi:ankyrin repeat protein
MEVLLQAGADPLKVTFNSGNNALFWACYKGHTTAAKQLLAHIKAKGTRGAALQFVGLKNRNGDTGQ